MLSQTRKKIILLPVLLQDTLDPAEALEELCVLTVVQAEQILVHLGDLVQHLQDLAALNHLLVQI